MCSEITLSPSFNPTKTTDVYLCIYIYIYLSWNNMVRPVTKTSFFLNYWLLVNHDELGAADF